MRNKILKSVAVAILVVLLTGTVALAYAYRASVSITENASTSHDMVSVLWNQNNEWLAANGFMTSTANDTHVQTLGGLNKPHLVADNKTLVAVPVPADSQTNLYFTTGDTPTQYPFYIMTGYGGYWTVADDATLELGDDFSIDFNDTYIDTNNGTSKNIIRKNDAIGVIVDPAVDGLVCAVLVDGTYVYNDISGVSDPVGQWSAPISNAYDGNQATLTQDSIAAASWSAYLYLTIPDSFVSSIRFDTFSSATVTTVEIDMYYNGAWNNIYDAIPANHTWVTVDVNGFIKTTGFRFRQYNLAGGPSNNGLYEFQHDGTVVTSVANVSSGEYDISVSANTTHLILDIGGSSNSTALGGASVSDNSTNYVFFENESAIYAKSVSFTIGGTEISHYEPESMILVTDLPDNIGANDGVITWGANPAGVGTTLGSLVSSGQPSIGGGVTTDTTDILPVVGGTDWRPTPGVSAALLANPLRPIVTAVSDNTTLSEYQVWVWYGIIFVVFITVLVGANVRGHHLITGIAASCAIVLLVVWTVFPWWALVVVVLSIWGGLISERSPSIG